MAKKNQEAGPSGSDESNISAQEVTSEPSVSPKYMKDLQERADKEREEENRNPEKIEELKTIIGKELLKDISKNPEDDLARFALADQFEEEGDIEMSAFVRSKDFLEIARGNIDSAKKIIEVRGKYQNEWWNSDDPKIKALGQFNEKILVLAPEDFIKSVSDALDDRTLIEVDPSDAFKLLGGPSGQQIRQKLRKKSGLDEYNEMFETKEHAKMMQDHREKIEKEKIENQKLEEQRQKDSVQRLKEKLAEDRKKRGLFQRIKDLWNNK